MNTEKARVPYQAISQIEEHSFSLLNADVKGAQLDIDALTQDAQLCYRHTTITSKQSTKAVTRNPSK